MSLPAVREVPLARCRPNFRPDRPIRCRTTPGLLCGIWYTYGWRGVGPFQADKLRTPGSLTIEETKKVARRWPPRGEETKHLAQWFQGRLAPRAAPLSVQAPEPVETLETKDLRRNGARATSVICPESQTNRASEDISPQKSRRPQRTRNTKASQKKLAIFHR